MKKYPSRILIIQTAFIGDVILATSLVEKLANHYSDAHIDFLVSGGKEELLRNNPHINNVLVFEKGYDKYLNLIRLIRHIHQRKYDWVINVQRFFTTGLITALSGADKRIGFKKNPLSFTFNESVEHSVNPDENVHEIERNHKLIRSLTNNIPGRPELYPSADDIAKIENMTGDKPYLTVAPASVWFTKQFPVTKWIEFLNSPGLSNHVFLIGSRRDWPICQEILENIEKDTVFNVAGELSLLETAALIGKASMNYTNDSAPLHMASAMNAPVTAIFCSTVPGFGFGPLSEESRVVEKDEPLYCRPCGLHGFRKCPEGHFKCALEIDNNRLLMTVPVN